MVDRIDGMLVFIPHNLEIWSVRTIERLTARGNDFGFIQGADGKVMWNDDGTLFNKKWAEKIVEEHNNWLKTQKPLSLKLLEARREAKRTEQLMNDARDNYDKSIVVYRESRELLGKYELEQRKLDKLNKEPKDGKDKESNETES